MTLEQINDIIENLEADLITWKTLRDEKRLEK